MQEPELKEHSRKNLEILVVDADPVARVLHHHRLKKNIPFPVTYLNDGTAALQHIQSHPESDFLVLLAIDMPGMNGWEFLVTLQSAPLMSQVHVIVVSCSVSSCDKRKALDYPQVLDYFEKPFSEGHVLKIPHLPRLIPYFVSIN